MSREVAPQSTLTPSIPMNPRLLRTLQSEVSAQEPPLSALYPDCRYLTYGPQRSVDVSWNSAMMDTESNKPELRPSAMS